MPKSAKRRWLSLLSGLLICTLTTTAFGDDDSDKHLIRLDFKKGQRLKYRFKTQGRVEHTPQKEGQQWFDGRSEIEFNLKGKTEREHGGGTYELNGTQLESRIKGPKGTLNVTADEDRIKIKRSGSHRSIKGDSPFKKEMTVTLGPRSAVRDGTGLFSIRPFFTIPVGHIFWRILSTAPAEKVGVGDKWDVDFHVRLPDSHGQKLKVKGHATVVGWRKASKRRCLKIAIEGRTDLADTTVTLRNGDKMHISSGRYEASGNVYWDAEKGIIVLVEAEARLYVRSTRPRKQTLEAEGEAELRLLSSSHPRSSGTGRRNTRSR